MKRSNHRYIWGIAFVLFLAVAITASVYISNVKQMVPMENEDVIALVPMEDDAQTEELDSEVPVEQNDKEIVKVGVPRSTLTNGAKTAGTVTQQHQIGSKKAEMITEDDVQVWGTETAVDIFKKYYTGTAEAGTEGEVTVENTGDVDDRKLIAPGTESEYTFWVKNTGETDISYRVYFEENQYGSMEIPLEVRVKCGDEYFLGNNSEWASIHELETVDHSGKLREKNYARYTLEWRWPFEIDDVYDTALGNQAVKELLEQEIIIYTYGEGEDIPIFDWVTGTGVKTGDAANALLWIGVALFCGITLVVVIVVKTKKNTDVDTEANAEEENKKEFSNFEG